MVTQVPEGELTSVEQALTDHVCRGERLDLAADDGTVHKESMRSWGDSRTCRAAVIRDILRGRLAANPDPHGVRLRGARISGRLDLQGLSTDVNLELSDCLLDEGLIAHDARLANVALNGCWIEHPTKPSLAAMRLTCSMLSLASATIIGHSGGGAVRLANARVDGEVSCRGAQLRNDRGPALLASSLQVGKDLILRDGFTAIGSANPVRSS